MNSGIPATHYAAIGVGLILLALSMITWLRRPRDLVHRLFLACFGLLSAYELTQGLFQVILFHTGRLVLPLHFANNVLIILVAPTFLHFCAEFPRRGNFSRKAILLSYLACLIVIPFTFFDGFIMNRHAVFVQAVDGYVFQRKFGTLFALVNAVPTVIVFAALAELVRKRMKAGTAPERTQLQFLLIGGAVTAVGLLSTVFLLPVLFDVYYLIAVGNLAPIVLCASTAYALSTQGMFDIPDTLIRATTALFVPFSALVSAGLFLRIVYGEQIARLPGGFLAVAAVAVFAAQLVLLRVLPRVKKFLPRHGASPAQENDFDRIAADLLLLRSGEEALRAAVEFARAAGGSEAAMLFMVPVQSPSPENEGEEANSPGDAYAGQKKKSRRKEEILDAKRAVIVENPESQTAGRKYGARPATFLIPEITDPVYLEIMPPSIRASILSQDAPAEEFITDNDIAIAVPLRGRGIRGVLYLGKRRDGRAYLPEELKRLGRICGALAIALENRANHRMLVEIRGALRRENAALADFSNRLSEKITRGAGIEILHGSDIMKETLATARKVAPTDANVIILGETGTGKELAAEYIHNNSKRAKRPLIKINCAAIPDTLLENELFGHERGAFTGAHGTYKGRFEQAHTGTIFLDEIGELPPQLQPKLLRVLQERQLERLGGTRTIGVDVRFIFATHQDLEKMVREGRFRSDLYYRINVINLRMPPLRERSRDIPLLAREFASRYAEQHDLAAARIPPETLEMLSRREWPGNIRQLQNTLLRAALATGGTYEAAEMAAVLREEASLEIQPAASENAIPENTSDATRDLPADLAGAMLELERRLILSALQDAQGNKSEAAKSLGLHPPSLSRKIKKLSIEV